MNLRKIPGRIKWGMFKEKSIMYRCLTFLTFIIAFALEKYINFEGRHTALFVLVMIISDMSLFNIISQAVISLLVTIVITYLSPIGLSRLIFHGVSHFIFNFHQYGLDILQ